MYGYDPVKEKLVEFRNVVRETGEDCVGEDADIDEFVTKTAGFDDRAVIAASADRFGNVRWRALQVLSRRSAHPETIDAVAEAVDDDEPSMTVLAVETLGKWAMANPSDRSLWQKLKKALRHHNGDVRLVALKRLADSPHPPVDEFIRMAKDDQEEDRRVRQEAMSAVVRHCPDDDVIRILSGIQEKAPIDVAREAKRLLRGRRSPDRYLAACQALEDEEAEGDEISGAIRTVATSGRADAVEVLYEFTSRDGDSEHADEVAIALAGIGDAEALNAFLRLAQEDLISENVWDEVMGEDLKALDGFDSEARIGALAVVLGFNDASLRATAVRRLGMIGSDAAIDAIARDILDKEEDDDEVFLAVVAAIRDREFGDKARVLTAIINETGDNDIIGSAFGLLADTDPAGALDYVTDSESSEIEFGVSDYLSLFGKLSGQRGEEAQEIVSGLVDGSDDENLIVAACRFLKDATGEAVISALAKLAVSEDDDVAGEAIEALNGQNAAEVSEALCEAIDDNAIFRNGLIGLCLQGQDLGPVTRLVTQFLDIVGDLYTEISEAIHECDGLDAMACALEFMKDETWQVRYCAVILLQKGELPKKVLLVLLAATMDEDSDVQEAANEALEDRKEEVRELILSLAKLQKD